jgi:large subunit ribosomal protein L10
MNREQKAATIDALASELADAEAIIAVDYRGLSVAEAAELRGRLREAQTTFRIVKNSLTERAAAQAGVEGLGDLLVGPTALAFVRGDAAVAAKAIAERARATQLLPFKGGIIGAPSGPTHALDAGQLVTLSRLPAREVLYGQLAGIVASPVGGLVRTLNALIGGLAIALGQVREQRASEPAASEGSVTAEAEAPTEAEVSTGSEAPAEAEANGAAEAAEAEAKAPEAPEAEAEAQAPEADAPAAEAEAEAPAADAAEQGESEKQDEPGEQPQADAKAEAADGEGAAGEPEAQADDDKPGDAGAEQPTADGAESP